MFFFNRPKLPLILHPFKDKIFETEREFIRIETRPDKDAPTFWNSKFGGLPYLPKDSMYPSNTEGQPLFFLAQINFRELPEMPNYPKKGILQFYVSPNRNYGLNFQDRFRQDGFRVVYFADPLEEEELIINDFSFLPEITHAPLAPSKGFQLTFSKKKELVATPDYRFDSLLGEDFFSQFGDAEWDLREEYGKLAAPAGHKMDGYAFFTQDDPRYDFEEHSELLLQLDTEKVIGLNWGSAGVANFFIKPEDLKNADFSNVLYNWDCY